MSKKWSVVVWIILWLALGLLFPTHEHFPMSGLFSPISAFIVPFMGNATHSTFNFDWQYIYLPALFFWLGGAMFIALTQYVSRLLKK